MHRTDADGNDAGQFQENDPPATRVDADWLNAVQEEIIAPILDAGIALVNGTWNQLLSALRILFVRATGDAAQDITGVKTFQERIVHDPANDC